LSPEPIFNALEQDRYGNTEPRYFQTMAPLLYRHRGTLLGYGFKLLPKDAAANLKNETSLQWIWDQQ